MNGPRSAALATLLLALALLASCAPPPRPGGTLDTLAERYAVRRDHRAALLRAFTADLVVRVDGRATGRLPALTATLALGAPDRMRLRVAAMLGITFDVLCGRDSLFAWVPSEKLAFAVPVESLGVGAPAAFAARALGATWAPPAQAWASAVADSTLLRLGWREGGDSLALVVGPDALPREAWIGRAGSGVRVRYEAWSPLRGEALPSRWRLADDSGWARVRVESANAQAVAQAHAEWFAPRRGFPAGALGWEDLRAMVAGRQRP